MTIPPLPQLKTFFSHSYAPDTGRTITWACSPEPLSCGLPAPIRDISSNTLAQLHAASSLETIQIPGRVENEWFGKNDAYWGSRRCYEKDGRASLIRTYTFGEEVFTHCRSYTAHHSVIDGGFIHQNEAMWEEHTDYAGIYVSADVLSAVYAAAGLYAAWTKPGRGLNLPTQAWDILRMWEVMSKQDIPKLEEKVVPANSFEGREG